jgi:hypothetical protein
VRPANTSNGLSSSEEGFFVAPAGTDVTQATDSQLIFNSNQNVFKIVAKIIMNTATLSVDANPGEGVISNSSQTTLNHNLGYIPAFEGYAYNTGASNIAYNLLPFTTLATAANNTVENVAAFSTIQPYADATTIYVTEITASLSWSSGGVSAGSFNAQTIVFYLLQESI